MKLLTSLITCCVFAVSAYAQPLYNKGCTAELKLSNGKSQATLYTHQAVMTYNPNSGILKIRLNLATLTSSVVSTNNTFSEEVLFPNDSTLLEIQVVISRDDLTKKNDAYDNARKTIPATLIYKSLQHSITADYQFGASMLDPNKPLHLNWDFRYNAMPGEEIYVPLFNGHATTLEFQMLDGLVNWVND